MRRSTYLPNVPHVERWDERQMYMIYNDDDFTMACVYEIGRNGTVFIRVPGFKRSYKVTELESFGWNVLPPIEPRAEYLSLRKNWQ